MSLPCAELREVLAPAYAPCFAFAGACATAEWAPALGRVPRGFVGAIGALGDVKLVILLAEPGGGFADESYPPSASAPEYVSHVVRTAYDALQRRRSQFHGNLRFVLDQCWPGEDLNDQLKKTWITETYLCSARQTAGEVPPMAERTCADTYLARQFALLPGRPVIALGGKAERRVGQRARVISAFAIGLPGANSPRSRPSWIAAAAEARRQLGLSAVASAPTVSSRPAIPRNEDRPHAALQVRSEPIATSGAVNWYVAESLSRVILHGDRTSRGVACEGYPLQYGTLYMHKVQLTETEVQSLRQRVENGALRQQWALPGVETWYFSKGGKARWPGTSIHSRCKQGPDGKWRPVPLTPAQLAEIDGS